MASGGGLDGELMVSIVVNELIEARADAFVSAVSQGAEMRRIHFRVDNESPPKKSGAKSMWGNEIQAERLVALRKKHFTKCDLNHSPGRFDFA